jgi:hypothetical protein
VKVAELLQQSFKGSHEILYQVMDQLDAKSLSSVPAGANIQSIQAILAHLVIGEDYIVHGMIAKKPPVTSAETLAGTGVPQPQAPRLTPEWAAQITMDLPRFTAYAKQVFAATETTVGGMTEEELDTLIDSPFGKRPAAALLTGFALYHTIGHTGEIAALKGIHGLKGLPF